MATKSDSFYCQECGRKFKTVAAAEKAASEGCPKCGGVDIDEGAPKSEQADVDPFARIEAAARQECPLTEQAKDAERATKTVA